MSPRGGAATGGNFAGRERPPARLPQPASDHRRGHGEHQRGGSCRGLRSVSDVRIDKVAAIQQALASGSYAVSASDVAGKLIDHLLQS